MKSILRRILGCITAAMLMCALPVLAFAAEGDEDGNGTPNPPDPTYSITVKNSNQSISIAGYTCSAYKVMDIEKTTVSDDSKSEDSYAYTFTNDFSSFTYDNLNGSALIKHLTDKTKEKTAITNTAGLASALSEWVISKSNSTQAIAPSSDPVTVAEGSEKAVLDGLSSGYYLVTVIPPAGNGEQVEVCLPILVLLMDENIEVNTKFETPNISKVITQGEGDNSKDVISDSVVVGSEVSFKLETNVPVMSEAFSEVGYVFTITDTWTTGLDYVKDSLNITIGNSAIDYTLVSASTEDSIADGAVTAVDDNVSTNIPLCTVNQSGNSLVITFDPIQFYNNYYLQAGTPITVSYKVSVTEALIDEGDRHAANDVKLTYSNKPGETTDTEKQKVDVYNLAIDVWKYTNKPDEYGVLQDKQYGIALKDAKFILYKEEGTEDDKVEKYYSLTTDNKVIWVDEKNKALQKTTNNNGNFDTPFDGLVPGVYYLEEVEAPEGYNDLAERIEVTLDESASYTGGYVEKKVENRKGIVLPGTGGMGTIIFYCVGGALVLGALVVLIARRRMASRDK